MTASGAAVLFVPVSGPSGSGEYYRCLNIARALLRRRPGLNIHFLLSRHAEVERDPAFTYHLLEASPTRDVSPVVDLIHRLKPALALFDCAGRMRQFRAVKAVGGRLVWLSNRPKKRAKGFRPGLLRLLDLHLMIEPGNPAPRLHPLQAFLLRHLGQARAEFYSAITPESDEHEADRELPSLPEAYAVFVTGGGGQHHRGRPVPEYFLEEARRFQRESGLAAVVVMGPQYRGEVSAHEEVRLIRHLSTRALGRLLAGASLAVSGAGNMLSSQVLVSGVPRVLVAVGGKDQPSRVQRYARAGMALPASLAAGDISEQALRLHREPALAEAQLEATARHRIRNDAGPVAERLLTLLDEAG